MQNLYDPFHVVRKIKQGCYYSLKALENQHAPCIKRLPVSIRIILESLLRNCDAKKNHMRRCFKISQLE